MKLRRAMVTAAATAVIMPLAFLSAPTAFADDDPATATSSGTSGSTATGGEEQDTTGGTTPEDQNSTSGENNDGTSTEEQNGTTGEENTNTTGGEDTTGEESGNTTGEENTTGENTPGEDGTGTGEEGTKPGDTTTNPAEDETPSQEGESDLCVDEDGNDLSELSADLTSGLSGLPETIVAGSGWVGFKFNVSNSGDQDIKEIAPLIGVAAIGWDDEEEYSGEITVQVLDKATGTWKVVAGAAGDGGTFTKFSLAAGKSTSYQLRLRVSGKVPDSLGVTGGFATYSDEGGCWIADDPNGWIYFFDILGAGSEAGKPNDAKPQTGGVKEISQVTPVEVTGNLAETGSNSALPVIGTVGGIAVLAGAGVVFAVRRRKLES
ncbi:LAETG motif-containing sortase-dependent surface protein [Streptomyces bobili]|uniref:LAETG motif-containing sortase-dependent surface protein n=1 Tax=Streptomyces bobili TaxID=67280 RepID=UPI00379D7899